MSQGIIGLGLAWMAPPYGYFLGHSVIDGGFIGLII